MVDFRDLKAQLYASEEAGLTEQVQVNQRHLIDKILARYIKGRDEKIHFSLLVTRQNLLFFVN